ncbi:hypothetical protein C5167_024381 [Papaver somniferum]|uniref:Uncharacterized protein n=1 Tax=Papaver somniferum TaxID=3469 RepID=A0A4Y7JNE8_PAPSO|nr:uncharacterized protein LOC113283338 [Papaver somniferum]RZC62624.1 hypothetical protein C5167_024381 [Papaver somniferum]
MSKFSGWSWLRYLNFFFLSVSLQLIPGFASDPSSSKDGVKTEGHASSSKNTGVTVLFVFVGLVAAVVLGVFLFKMWQKKKRAEQHARLLRLFEEDDELELELGLRD